MYDLLKSLVGNPGSLFLFMALMIPIVGIICYAIAGIVEMIIKHRERMEMINQGIHPDSIPDKDDDEK